MAVVEGEIARPAARLGELEGGLEECGIIGQGGEGYEGDIRAFPELEAAGKRDDAIFDFADVVYRCDHEGDDSRFSGRGAMIFFEKEVGRAVAVADKEFPDRSSEKLTDL